MATNKRRILFVLFVVVLLSMCFACVTYDDYGRDTREGKPHRGDCPEGCVCTTNAIGQFISKCPCEAGSQCAADRGE